MDRDDARAAPQYGELSAEQLLELESVVKDFVSNVGDTGIEGLDKILPMMGHGSHENKPPQVEGDNDILTPTAKKK
jgi:hypothetical protein